jgi:hypothetical protein
MSKQTDKQQGRPILYAPVGDDGLFIMPTSITVEDEVMYAKRRMDSVRLAQYADSRCGLSNTYDPMGAYLCGGLKDGSSAACNKLAPGDACLIRITEVIAKPHQSSCGFWEVTNFGDPEGKYCPGGRFNDTRMDFGTTPNPRGFGCERCEYGEGILNQPDSEGRPRWCSMKGHPVEDKSCCADNEPDVDGDDDDDTPRATKIAKKVMGS